MTTSTFAERLWRIGVQFHIALYRFLKGRGIIGRNMILVTTIGRKSGEPRTTPLISVKDGKDYIIIASYGGSAKHPTWYLNLMANPHVTVEDHDRVIPTIATTVQDEAEYQGLWTKMTAVYAPYDSYQKRTTRKIPVVKLSPTSA